MTMIAADLAGVLEGVDRPGDFAMGGSVEMLAPGLLIDGLGPIALPVLPAQSE